MILDQKTSATCHHITLQSDNPFPPFLFYFLVRAIKHTTKLRKEARDKEKVIVGSG
jgi:hypothetical protein